MNNLEKEAIEAVKKFVSKNSNSRHGKYEDPDSLPTNWTFTIYTGREGENKIYVKTDVVEHGFDERCYQTCIWEYDVSTQVLTEVDHSDLV
jgi:hypothetical protein